MREVTVRFLDQAWEAVEQDAQMLEMTRTDTINRAAQLQHVILQELQGDGELLVRRADGGFWRYNTADILGMRRT